MRKHSAANSGVRTISPVRLVPAAHRNRQIIGPGALIVECSPCYDKLPGKAVTCVSVREHDGTTADCLHSAHYAKIVEQTRGFHG